MRGGGGERKDRRYWGIGTFVRGFWVGKREREGKIGEKNRENEAGATAGGCRGLFQVYYVCG